MTIQNKTMLVTGANSGLGFEASAQLAEEGAARVILGVRSQAKGEDARARLVQRVGRDPFEVLVVDLASPHTLREAVSELHRRGGALDGLVLNAGLMSGEEIQRVEGGIERTVAASLSGHHSLVVGLLESGLLADEARLVVAGSEAARGDLPMMGLLDLRAFAAQNTGGQLVPALEMLARAEAPYVYAQMPHYANTKLLLAWWVSALARRLPVGMAAFTVSPGSVPDTSVSRHQGWLMRSVFVPLSTSWLGQKLGMGATVGSGARRYLDGLALPRAESGRFYASAPGKVVGPMVRQELDHLLDEELSEATWAALAELTGAELSPVRAVAN